MSDFKVPNDCVYTEHDEWVRMQGDRAIVGISDYAQEQLGDIVFVELPEVGASLVANQPFGIIESVKAVSDLYSPASGEIVEVNTGLADRPESVNEDCYGDGWIIAIGTDALEQYEALLDASAYRRHLAETKG